jgi:hypothetical protein
MRLAPFAKRCARTSAPCSTHRAATRPHHRRIVRRTTVPISPIGPVERVQIERVDGVQHERRQVTLRQPIPHPRRQQQLLITITTQKVLGHPRSLRTPPDNTTLYATASRERDSAERGRSDVGVSAALRQGAARDPSRLRARPARPPHPALIPPPPDPSPPPAHARSPTAASRPHPIRHIPRHATPPHLPSHPSTPP